jgi:hypothetical protein
MFSKFYVSVKCPQTGHFRKCLSSFVRFYRGCDKGGKLQLRKIKHKTKKLFLFFAETEDFPLSKAKDFDDFWKNMANQLMKNIYNYRVVLAIF